jgi:hypothetical protein
MILKARSESQICGNSQRHLRPISSLHSRSQGVGWLILGDERIQAEIKLATNNVEGVSQPLHCHLAKIPRFILIQQGQGQGQIRRCGWLEYSR